MIAIDDFPAGVRECATRAATQVDPLYFAADHAPRTVAAIRALITGIPIEDRCDPECPTWIVSESDLHGTQIERCDECWSGRSFQLDDDDLRRLPEAQAALAARGVQRGREFAVSVTITIPFTRTVYVTALDEHAARAAAIHELVSDPTARPYDWEGKPVAINPDDVTIDDVDPA